MSRTLVCSAILLTAIAVSAMSARAQAPSSGTLSLTDTNSYSGGTTIVPGPLSRLDKVNFSGGTLQVPGYAPPPAAESDAPPPGKTWFQSMPASGTTVQGGYLIVTNTAAVLAAPSGPRRGGGTLVLTGVLNGTNTYTGSTVINNGADLGSWGVDTANNYISGTVENYTLNVGSAIAGEGEGITLDAAGVCGGNNSVYAPRGPITPIPKGPLFYIITEGAGLGDSVRTVPCTGNETVMSAVGAIGGISQVSGTRIWIARPSPGKADKSTILPVDWEAISKRGINTTNYKLMPGDRLVFGEDPATTRTNLLSKKAAPIERVGGIVSLAISTLKGVQNTPGGGKLVKDLVEKNLITDDPQLKTFILDAIRDGAESKKPAANAKDEAKPRDGKAAVHAADGAANLVLQVDQGGGKPKSGEPSKGHEITIRGTLVLDASVSKGPESSAPHELAMQPLPAYRIEPPDIISIEMLKLIPLPPYRAGVFDVLQIKADATPDKPIDQNYMIEAEGEINFGPPYGSVKVKGMTLDEVRKAVNKFLSASLKNPNAYVQLSRLCGMQPITGQYLVGPDGTINLRAYGRVTVSGKTVAEVKADVESHLKKFLVSPEVSVDVVAYNSKMYFVITQGAGLGDSVRRLPVTGNETVLDAIAQVGGLSQLSDGKRIRIVRPSASDPKQATVLPVDWDAVTRRGETATNYQILPRDRVYIGGDRLMTTTNLLSKKTAPIERAMGVISLATSTVQGINAAPGGAAAVKQLVQKGVFDDDPQVKRIVEETIRISGEKGKNAAGKPAKTATPGQ
jgi:polysaccharide export outer membrane protein